MAPCIQKMIRSKPCRGEPRLTEHLSRAGLVKFVGDDDTLDDEYSPRICLPPSLKVNGRLQVEERVSDLKMKLWQYLDRNKLRVW